jgi:hypothetical protein
MTKGMWTKCISNDGKVFYFNASQNRSAWNPPPDSIIHEAPNLRQPIPLIEQTRNDEAYHDFQNILTTKTDNYRNEDASLTHFNENIYEPTKVSIAVSAATKKKETAKNYVNETSLYSNKHTEEVLNYDNHNNVVEQSESNYNNFRDNSKEKRFLIVMYHLFYLLLNIIDSIHN